MKKTKGLSGPNNVMHVVGDSHSELKNSNNILKELEIPERTQKPPSAELIARLNELASNPPFCYLHKAKENDMR